uniref:CCHC-type domain-containing protein n=1 Tax=Plectus sambesii TaxID=2011161 RepID=A0A914WST9_9BILA
MGDMADMTDKTTRPIIVPTPTFDGSPEEFEIWLIRFRCAMRLSRVADEKKKVAMLLCSLSLPVVGMLIARCSPKDITDCTYDELITLLEKDYKPAPLPLAEYQLFNARQKAGVSSSDFAVQICTIAASCSWPIDRDRALAIAFTMGIRNDEIRAQLLESDHKTLNLALEQARQLESIQKACSRGGQRSTNSSELSSHNQMQHQRPKQTGGSTCHRCGGNNHRGDSCRFKGETCRRCAKIGHIERVCKSRPKH